MHEILLSFGLIILAGAVFRRFRFGGLDPDTTRNAINNLVLNIFLPALGLWAMYHAHIGIDAILVPLTAWITTLATLATAYTVYRVLGPGFGLNRKEQGVLIIAATFGNVTYLGLPVLRELYGTEAIKYALYYDLLATTPILWLAGAPLAARFGTGSRFGLGHSLKTIIKLPPLWGIALGMALNLGGITLPQVLLKTLDMLGSLVIPLMVFSIGLALSMPNRKNMMSVMPALIIKLAFVPLLSYVIASALGLEGVALSACLLEGAMPTMVLSLLIAAMFGLDISLAAFVIVLSTALAFFTLPFVASLSGGL